MPGNSDCRESVLWLLDDVKAKLSNTLMIARLDGGYLKGELLNEMVERQLHRSTCHYRLESLCRTHVIHRLLHPPYATMKRRTLLSPCAIRQYRFEQLCTPDSGGMGKLLREFVLPAQPGLSSAPFPGIG